jgi:hypothetical protein
MEKEMNRPILKELNLDPCTQGLSQAAERLEWCEFKKVKTKYTKGEDWTAISFHGYGPHPLDILKPGVLKSQVMTETKLQYTSLFDDRNFESIIRILDRIPAKKERVRFMKLQAGKVIGRHTDKIDKQIGFDDGDIIRIHIPIQTNEQVIFTLYESPRDKIGTEYNLKTGHYYYTDVTKPHAVRNESEVDRIHLVADCFVNQELRNLIL